MSDAINVHDLTFHYPGQNSPIIQIEQWSVARGSKQFIVGKSGSGKSTLLNLLCGTLQPDSGNITLLGQPFSTLSKRQKDKFRARHIGVVFQQFNLIPYLSVEQNIQAAAYFADGWSTTLQSANAERIALLNLPTRILQQRADQLSVGQQQRVAIARALINQPELLIVDEPTSALDSDARDSFIQLLFQCVEESNSSLLFVSHDRGLAQHFTDIVNIADFATTQEQSQ